MTPAQFVSACFIGAIPRPPVKSVCQWAKQNVRLVGSARSEAYNPDITPWTKEPLERAADGTRKVTFVKPVQCGGSAVGEIAICYWLATQNGGDIQYNWQNDSASDARWSKRVEKILLACDAVVSRITDRGPDGIKELKRIGKWTKGLAIFPHCNFTMQGVKTDRNVASDSIRFQVNEELHDKDSGWEDGKLQQCYNRTTAFWNSVIFNISNAGYKDDQLHKAFLSGTQQHWEVKCPGCGLYHPMRTRWEKDKPELGGLRYDKEETGKVVNIRYQMPCGFAVLDDISERRKLSLSGRYSQTYDNPSASDTERSYTLEAVAVDYIPWLTLIQEKHKALAAKENGDPIPWYTYLRERECQFVDPAQHRYAMPAVVLSSDRRKDREGLKNRVARFGSADRQKGTKAAGELPHWWHLIADIEIEPRGRVHILIVSEGKILTDANLIDTFKRHEVVPSCVILDSAWDTDHVYQIAMSEGYYTVKGEGDHLFAGHDDGSKKIYSPPRPLHAMINQPPNFDYVHFQDKLHPNPDEPMFMHYNKYALLDFVSWLRTTDRVFLEVPSDVSEDFTKHLASWGVELRKKKGSEEQVKQWVQYSQRDDLLMCLGYIGLLILDAGIIGESPITNAEVENQSVQA